MGVLIRHIPVMGPLELLQAIAARRLQLKMSQRQSVVLGRDAVFWTYAHQNIASFGDILAVVVARSHTPAVLGLKLREVGLGFRKIETVPEVLAEVSFFERSEMTLTQWKIFIFEQRLKATLKSRHPVVQYFWLQNVDVTSEGLLEGRELLDEIAVYENQ